VDDHNKMPCWKQYFVLFIGSLAVVGCTLAVTIMFAIIPPIVQYFTMFSFGGAVPLSLLLHISARTIMRYVRIHLALRRGRRVAGIYRKEKPTGPASVGAAKTRQSRFSLRKSHAYGPDGHAGDQSMRHAGDRTSADELQDIRQVAIRRDVSAHIKSSTLDAAQSLHERMTSVSESIHLEMDSDQTSRQRVSVAMAGKGDGHAGRFTDNLGRNSSSIEESKPKAFTSPDAPVVDKTTRVMSRKAAAGRAQKLLGAAAGGTVLGPEGSTTNDRLSLVA